MSATPGPWEQYENDDGLIRITDRKRSACMVDICNIQIDFDEPFDSEQRANARLIAAAPELLKALLDIVKHQESIGGSMVKQSTIWLIATNAIAKAQG